MIPSIATIAALRAHLKQAKRSIQRAHEDRDVIVGFMPTLGYMHEGHLSLIARAKQECDIVVVSIFVNPLQFGKGEDFETYPRDAERDVRLAEQAGADVVFAPSVDEMYPQQTKTTVVVKQLTDVLCGASRPGHFEGVATVVAKLFQIVQPDRAYFGMKDAQQVAVIEQMTADLNIPVHIVRCPTLREEDGLAKSSRNVYLDAEARKQAVVLYNALEQAEQWIKQPDMTVEQLLTRVRAAIETAPLAVIDYVQLVTYPGMEIVQRRSQLDGAEPILLALAVKFGSTRLIDNRIFFTKEDTTSCS